VLRAALLIVALVGGCRRSTPAPIPEVVEVRVVDRTPTGDPALPPVDVAALTARAAAGIRASSGLPVVDGGAGPAKLRLRVEVRLDGAEDAAAGKGVMRAFVRAKLLPFDVGALSFDEEAMAERTYELKKRPDAAAWRAHAEHAVDDVLRGLGARARLAASDGAALVAALGGKDDDLRDEAVRLAAERRERTAVPALIALLKSEDPAVRDRALGALAQIGDPRAVRPLTEVARFRDVGDLPKVLDALAAIGGDEAQAYLEFVASGHDSPEMRDLAKQALGHLTRRRDALRHILGEL
jgi:hypothetical protein